MEDTIRKYINTNPINDPQSTPYSLHIAIIKHQKLIKMSLFDHKHLDLFITCK